MAGVTTLLTEPDVPASGYSSVFEIGGVSVQIAGENENDVALGPSLRAFSANPRRVDVDIRVEWRDELFWGQERRLFDSGSVWQLYECEQGLQFDFSSSSFGQQPYKRLVIDQQFRSAVLQMSKKSFARCCRTADPMDYPLDELLIMHRLTQEKAIELHGCGIVQADGVGNLFIGHSGAGKSTTTRLWTEFEDVEILSDDRIIVRCDEPAHPVRSETKIASELSDESREQGVLRLRDGAPSRRIDSAQDDRTNAPEDNKISMYGTPWHGEARYASPGNAQLARIFILEHGQGNVLTLLSPPQAIAELLARSFVPFYRHQYVDSALKFLQEVVNRVPCYRYAFEPNQAAVERILELRD
jgi:hypothetical protein